MSDQGAAEDVDPDYLKRVSQSLRKQLSKPVVKVQFNPTFNGQAVEGDDVSHVQRDVNHAVGRGGHPAPTMQAATASGLPMPSFRPSASSYGALPSSHISYSFPSGSGPPPPLQIPSPAATPSFQTQGTAVTGIWQQQQQQQRQLPVALPPVVSTGSGALPVQQGMPPPGPSSSRERGRGTRSGPYEGFASGRWLEIEMRNHVDDLAHKVDRYASTRQNKVAEEDKAVLVDKVEQLEKKVSEQAARIHELELLSPGEDGEYKLLKQELKDLEKDCDYYFSLWKEENKAKSSAQKTIAEALDWQPEKEQGAQLNTLLNMILSHSGHLNDIEAEFDRVKKMVEDPAGFAAEAKAQLAALDIEQGLNGVAVVSPEMVLAAEQAVGRQRSLIDPQRIVIRLALVVLFLSCIAGAILGTYFLTRQYG